MLLSTTAQLMSTAAFLPSICEQLGKQAREDEGQLMSPVTVLLFNYYCFQIPFSIHSSIYVLIGPFNNQKTETAKVSVCVLSAVPLCSCDKSSVANFCCFVVLGLCQPARFLLVLVTSSIKNLVWEGKN